MQILNFSVAVELQRKPILNSNILELCFRVMASANLGPERKEEGVAREVNVSEISCSHVCSHVVMC